MNSLIIVLIDCSGSMWSAWPATAAGANTFIKMQQMRQDDAHFYMAMFDHGYHKSHDFTSVFDVAPLSPEMPGGGSTAMYDAIQTAIRDADTKIRSLPKAEQPINVSFCIIGDGANNASAHKLADIKKAIAERNNWQWIFLSSDASATREAATLGITNVIQYKNSSPEETVKIFETIGRDILESVVTGSWKHR